jgi:hypothetical protein
MKNKSIFRVLGLFAFVALLFASSHFVPQMSSQSETDNVAILSQDDVVAVQLDTVSTALKGHDAEMKKGLESKVKAEVKKASVKKETKQVAAKTTKELRACVTAYMESQVGVREKTNNNDGPAIYAYFKTVGWKTPEKLKPSQRFYCGAFMGTAWLSCLDSIKFVKSNVQLASVRYWERGPHISQADAQPGDAVTLKGYSHVEGIYTRHPNPTFKFYTAITANSSPEANDPDRRGGVFKKTRLWSEAKTVISLAKTAELLG